MAPLLNRLLGTALLSLFTLSILPTATASEVKWLQHEQQARGNLQKMLHIVDKAPQLMQPRMRRSAAELTELLSREGRFQELGLAEEEGRELVRKVYGKLGIPLEGETQPTDVMSNAPIDTPTSMRAGTEFEPLSAIHIRWPFDWPALTSDYIALVDAFSKAGVTIQILVDRKKQQASAEQLLIDAGIPLQQIEWRIENTDSIWIRDYGPQYLKSLVDSSGAIVDFHYYRGRPHDDRIPIKFAASTGLPLIDRQHREAVFTEGGNLMHDGLGTVIYSQRTYQYNRVANFTVDQRITSAFQAWQNIVLPEPSLDSTGHVDMFMKVLNENTILVGQYTPDQTDYAMLEQAASQLSQLTNGEGQPWQIIRIPQPEVYYSNFVIPVVRTYTNAQMVNNIVVVPVYDLPSDEEALDIYRNALPGKEVIGVNANGIIESGGAWHCVTMEKPIIN